MTALLRRLLISAAAATLLTTATTTVAATGGHLHSPLPWVIVAAFLSLWALAGVVAIRDHIDTRVDCRIDSARSDVEVRIETSRKYLDGKLGQLTEVVRELASRVEDLGEKKESEVFAAGVAVGRQQMVEESREPAGGGPSNVAWLRQPNGI